MTDSYVSELIPKMQVAEVLIMGHSQASMLLCVDILVLGIAIRIPVDSNEPLLLYPAYPWISWTRTRPP